MEWVIDKFSEVGLQDVAAHKTPDGSDAVPATPPAPGAPTVLLYSHYDVQPPLGEDEWECPSGSSRSAQGAGTGEARPTARATSSCSWRPARARRAGGYPVNVRFVAEGSEEQGTGGLEAVRAGARRPAAADAILVCDTGNFAVGVPTVTTSLRGLANVRGDGQVAEQRHPQRDVRRSRARCARRTHSHARVPS